MPVHPARLGLLLRVALVLACCATACSDGGGRSPKRKVPLTVTIQTPTTAPTYSTDTAPVLLGGICWDDEIITSVTWSNAATGDAGTAAGTVSWSVSVDLVVGRNPITVMAHNAIAETGTDSITVVLNGDGYAWGENDYGQLGDGTTGTSRLSPVQVVDPTGPSGFLGGVVAVAANNDNTTAALADGTVRTWGRNNGGQLGDGTRTDSSVPVQVIDPSDPSGFLAGVLAVTFGHTHAAALKGDGSVWVWGEGILAVGGASSTVVPLQVIDPSDASGFLAGVTAIGAGDNHTIALLGDGTVRAWGDNARGTIGDGTTTDREVPVQVVDPSDPSGYVTRVTAIAAGLRHNVALLDDGTVRTWGDNLNGQLGDGLLNDSTVPVQVVDPSDSTGFLTGVTAVASGYRHTMALLADGSVRAWGANSVGQIGNNTVDPCLTPVQVVDPAHPSGLLIDVRGVAAGRYHSIALLDDTSVRTWGSNMYGQLGMGSTLSGSLVPIQVVDPSDPTGFLTGVDGIAAGRYHTLAIK